MNNSILIAGGAVALVLIIFLSNTLMRPNAVPTDRPILSESNAPEDSSLPNTAKEQADEWMDEDDMGLVVPDELDILTSDIVDDSNIVGNDDVLFPPPPPTPPSLDTQTSANTTTEESLTNTPWQWVDTAGTFATTSATTRFILTFNNDGSVRSTTDCNNLGGLYKLNDTALTFGDMFSTLMYCEGSQEQTYREQLSKIERYTIDGTTLYLSLTEDQGTMRFIAQ